MKTILLVCNAGMSTSMLVKRMQQTAEERDLKAEIFAVPLSGVKSEVEKKDIGVILVGPQVRFKVKELKNKYEPEIPVDVIETVDYGTMNGENVMNKALQMLGES